MKSNIIFYFSSTGNGLSCAMQVASSLGNTTLVNMAKNNNYNYSGDYDYVGFIFPTYYGGLPKLVKSFMEKITFNNKANYYYTITNYAGMIGNGSRLATKVLSDNNIDVSYAKKVKMHSNYITHFQTTHSKYQSRDLAYKQIDKILVDLFNKKVIKIKPISRFVNLYYNVMINKTTNSDSNFIIDEGCTSCGICAKVCPVSNIELVNSLPNFNHHCEQCFACIHHCPTHAINYKNNTINKVRYHHPDTSLKDFM